METLFQLSIDKWGTDTQILLCAEELNELQKELFKDLRGKDVRNNIIEEIADVEIMIAQMKYIFNIDEEEILKWKEFKLDRLKKLIFS